MAQPFYMMAGTLCAVGVGTVMYLVANKPTKTQRKKRNGRKSGKKFIIGGNWKCETDCAMVDEIITRLNTMGPIPDAIELYVCPPFPHLATTTVDLRADIAVSSQDSGTMAKYGAFTGDAFAGMLKNVGCEWSLLGHSERRQYQNESSELVAAKAKAALNEKLGVVVCIGESKAEREAGIKTMEKVLLDDQMSALLKAIGPSADAWANVVIAYEPVWAIGTGLSASPKQAQDTHKLIRDWVKAKVSPGVAANLRIQYGGSVKGNTAKELAAQPDIDGFLVGGSSLKDDFLLIISQAAEGLKMR